MNPNQPGHDERIALNRPVDPLSLLSETEKQERVKKQKRDSRRRIRAAAGVQQQIHHPDFPRSQRSDVSALSEEEKRERKREICRKNRLKKKAICETNQGGQQSV